MPKVSSEQAMLIIGHGMLAKAFAGSGSAGDGLIAFCSGISNSHETAQTQFDRERALLMDTMARNPDMKIIYFSSCAAEFGDNPYYRHKRDMEACLMHQARHYLICRLPQAVGVTSSNTLINGIVRKIRCGEPVTVICNAKRNLLDVEDVVRLSLRLAELDNMRIGVTNGKMTAIEDIIGLLSDLLGTPAILEYRGQESGSAYDGRLLQELIGPDDPIYSDDYNRTVLAKYVMRLGTEP